jgi:hypothetical protein
MYSPAPRDPALVAEPAFARAAEQEFVPVVEPVHPARDHAPVADKVSRDRDQAVLGPVVMIAKGRLDLAPVGARDTRDRADPAPVAARDTRASVARADPADQVAVTRAIVAPVDPAARADTRVSVGPADPAAIREIVVRVDQVDPAAIRAIVAPAARADTRAIAVRVDPAVTRATVARQDRADPVAIKVSVDPVVVRAVTRVSVARADLPVAIDPILPDRMAAALAVVKMAVVAQHLPSFRKEISRRLASCGSTSRLDVVAEIAIASRPRQLIRSAVR